MSKVDRAQEQVRRDLANKLRLEKIVSKEIRSLFKRIRDDFRIGMAGGKPINARKYTPEWISLLEKHYKRTQDRFIGSVASFNEAKSFQFKQEDPDKDLFDLALLNYREDRARTQAEFITRTTRQNMLDSIAWATKTAVEKGLDLGRRALSALASTSLARKFLGRVEGIATLETQAPAEATKLLEAESLASELPDVKKSTKQWWTVGDKVVRPTHKSMNRKMVGIDDNFIVGGYPMRHPGDSSLGAPLREVANCRCSVVYTVY